ncbi:MAG: polysaccharide pyruvyl transferase family protein [Leptolyngbya sp. SIOISBB]|nr:polysaccharide pyruvyl transferase family protein [Leptolyngbya sp. SIOISBB]
MPDKLKLLVSGPYGGLNYGDDAIALAIKDELQCRGISVTFAVNDVAGARSLFPDIPILPRLNLRSGRVNILPHIREYDCIVVGGGEQLSEPRLPNFIWGHLATNLQLCLLAKLSGKKFALLAVGVDANLSCLGRFLMRLILPMADFISVRDVRSQQRLQKLLQSSEIMLGSDPAFLLEPYSHHHEAKLLKQKYHLPGDTKTLLIMPCIDKFNSLAYIENINSAVKEWIASGIRVFYAVSDTQNSYDMRLFNERILFTHDMATWLSPTETGLEEICRTIVAVDCVISSRMHPIIFAAVNQTPFICLIRSAKMSALMEMLTSPSYFYIEQLDKKELTEKASMILWQSRTAFFQPIKPAIETLKQRAAHQFNDLTEALI